METQPAADAAMTSAASTPITGRSGPRARSLRGKPLTTGAARQVGFEDDRHDLGLVRSERQRRARDRLSRDPREGQPEHRTTALFAPRLQPPAVQPGVLQRDGEPQPGPAGAPGPCRVRTPEPLEDQLVLPRAKAHAVIP